MTTAIQTRPPRQYFGANLAGTVLPEPGLPQDRHARIAARRTFVDLKQQFMAAIESLDGMRGDWLRHQVRQSHEPVDLWMLRGAVFAALESQEDDSRRSRNNLTRVLDSAFPDNGTLRAWGTRL
ncbi:MAG: hypothetical protein QE285_11350 [Aquabacterium sp.]|nr:hypothetical protein [Aquabacterium sp.]